MAIFQKSSVMPAATSAFCTRSWSPTEAPPSVTSTSTFASTRFADRRVELGHGVAGDAEVDRDAAAGLDDPRHGEIVGGDDLRGAERPAGRDEFVAGGEDCDPGVAAHRQHGVIGRRRQRHVAGREPPPGRQQRFAFAEIEPFRAQVVADRDGRSRA